MPRLAQTMSAAQVCSSSKSSGSLFLTGDIIQDEHAGRDSCRVTDNPEVMPPASGMRFGSEKT
jgi:hypothetical protein